MDHGTESTSLLEFLFERAMVMPAPERADFLDRECPDAELRGRVESLLKSHDDAGCFLDTSDRTSLWPLAEDQAGPSLVGRSVKQYRVTRRIGVGGMGVVYEAEQSSPKRRVALKVLRQERISRSAGRRIAIEAEALGRLNHPGVAQIIEAGAADLGEGPQPFFVMELVEGDTLLEFIRNRNLSTRERLRLFVRICEAVHHAHQKGVIHRDLKPGNILVVDRPGAEDGGGDGPRPKVLDFGVARATDSDIQHTTVQSDSGALIGTVAYMSPEQIRGEMESVDARSDVYALGVVLFEMLSGRLPHDVRSKPIPEAMRMISEDEPTMLGSIDRSLRGDLDTITRTAMSRSPARRYVSAAALADDVRRHLAHEPIAARAPSAAYRVGKFVRRHRALAVFALLLVALLIGSFLAINAERLDAVRARQEAERQYEEAMRLSNFFLSDIVTRLERAPGTIDIRRDLIDEILRQTHSQLASRPDDYQLLTSHARALDARSSLLSYDDSNEDEAYEIASETLKIRERIIALNPDDSWQRMKYAVSLVKLAQSGAVAGRIDDTTPYFVRAHEIDEDLARRHPEERRYLDNLFWSRHRMSQRLFTIDREQADAWLELARQTAEELLERFPDHYLTMYAQSHVHYTLSFHARRSDEHEKADQHSLLAIHYLDRLLEQYPNSRQFMIHGVYAHWHNAIIARRMGDRRRAEASLRDGAALIEQLAPFEPHSDVVDELRRRFSRTLARLDEWIGPEIPARP